MSIVLLYALWDDCRRRVSRTCRIKFTQGVYAFEANALQARCFCVDGVLFDLIVALSFAFILTTVLDDLRHRDICPFIIDRTFDGFRTAE